MPREFAKCPYRGLRCPIDVPIDQEDCCDNEFYTCGIFQQYEIDQEILESFDEEFELELC